MAKVDKLIDANEETLSQILKKRSLAPDLVTFLSRILGKMKSGSNKRLFLHQTEDNVAAVIIFEQSLEEKGFHFHDELHLYFQGRVITERWQIKGENGYCLPFHKFLCTQIRALSVEGSVIKIELTLPEGGIGHLSVTREFNFNFSGKSLESEARHPFSNKGEGKKG